MSKFYTAKELKERMNSNDNRCTAKPYLLLLQKKVKYVAHDEYDNGNTEDVWVEYYTGDYMEADSKEELIDCFVENGYCNDDGTLDKEILESIEKVRYSYFWETQNVFLTDKGYQDHLDVNKHNLREHRTYGIHAFRNKEMESLLNLVDNYVDLEEKVDKMKEAIKEMKYFLESHNRFLKDEYTAARVNGTTIDTLFDKYKEVLEEK
jgi:hypothetical protein